MKKKEGFPLLIVTAAIVIGGFIIYSGGGTFSHPRPYDHRALAPTNKLPAPSSAFPALEDEYSVLVPAGDTKIVLPHSLGILKIGLPLELRFHRQYWRDSDEYTFEIDGGQGTLYEITGAMLIAPSEHGGGAEGEEYVALFREIHEARRLTNETKKRFIEMEENTHNPRPAVALLRYFESTDGASRGVSYMRLGLSEWGLHPRYLIEFYHPGEDVLVRLDYAIPGYLPELAGKNDVFRMDGFDPERPEETSRPYNEAENQKLLDLDIKIRADFRNFLERSRRSDLSFGGLLTILDEFMESLKF